MQIKRDPYIRCNVEAGENKHRPSWLNLEGSKKKKNKNCEEHQRTPWLASVIGEGGREDVRGSEELSLAALGLASSARLVRPRPLSDLFSDLSFFDTTSTCQFESLIPSIH
jgi:hypothetical protein